MRANNAKNFVEFQLYRDIPGWAENQLHAYLFDVDEDSAWRSIRDIATNDRVNLKVYDREGKWKGTVAM